MGNWLLKNYNTIKYSILFYFMNIFMFLQMTKQGLVLQKNVKYAPLKLIW